ncbi:MAG: hypothetical protein VW989_12595, partial [Rhodobiaceae bacterium]
MSKTNRFDAQNYLARRARNEARLTAAGVYGPQMEHDACGVGFEAAQDRSPSLADEDTLEVGPKDLGNRH